MEIDAVSAILELVAEGHGYAVLSRRALDGADADQLLAAADHCMYKAKQIQKLILVSAPVAPAVNPVQLLTIQ